MTYAPRTIAEVKHSMYLLSSPSHLYRLKLELCPNALPYSAKNRKVFHINEHIVPPSWCIQLQGGSTMNNTVDYTKFHHRCIDTTELMWFRSFWQHSKNQEVFTSLMKAYLKMLHNTNFLGHHFLTMNVVNIIKDCCNVPMKVYCYVTHK